METIGIYMAIIYFRYIVFIHVLRETTYTYSNSTLSCQENQLSTYPRLAHDERIQVVVSSTELRITQSCHNPPYT